MNFIRKIVLAINMLLKGLAEDNPEITKEEISNLDNLTDKILNQLKEND